MGLFDFLLGNSKEKQHAQMMAPQWLKIVEDSVRLVNTTTNPAVFFFRYNLMVEHLEKLTQIEHLVRFSGTRPSAQLSKVTSERNYQTSLFIKRSHEKMMHETRLLKTERGKLNKIETFFKSMDSYNTYLSASNRAMLDKMKFNSKNQVRENTV